MPQGRVDGCLERGFELPGHVDGKLGHRVTTARVTVRVEIFGLKIEHQARAGSNDLNLCGSGPH
jgi:hypothetical protein